jgi:hypothetical protein
MKKILKRSILLILVAFLLIQFYPKATENNGGQKNAFEISSTHVVPSDVMDILHSSCYDCHSNQTYYPWYSKIQPVNFWLNNHITEGKDELNFSEFGSYSIRRQYHKLKEIAEQVSDNEMPLKSYTLIHRSAALDASKKEKIIQWANVLRTGFEATYPADSLKRKKRKVS